MTTPVYAVKIKDGKMVGDLFPIYPWIWLNSKSAEYGSVYLNTIDEEVRRDSPEFIASIPFTFPAGVEITKDNWAGFLYHRLRQKDDSTLSIASEDLGSRRGFTSVKTYLSFGYYYFELKGTQCGDLGIIVDRPQGSPRPFRKIPNRLIANNESKGDDHRYSLMYNDEQLALGYFKLTLVSPGRRQEYNALFKERLSLNQIMKIYVEGIDTLEWSEDLFRDDYNDLTVQDLEESRGLRRNTKDQLVFRSLKGLTYLATVDESIRVFLDVDAVFKAFRSARQMFRDKSADPEIDRDMLDDLTLSYIDLTDFFFYHPDKDDETLGQCLEFLKR